MTDLSADYYPRPLLRRAQWTCLNGIWRFTFDPDRRYSDPSQIATWPLAIRVPFPPESAASGMRTPRLSHRMLVRARLRVAPGGQRVILHFGAVDYVARVWVNGRYVTSHEGGHTPFRADITAAARCVRPADRHGAGRGRSARSRQAARQAGLAARAAFDLVSAHDRHLADRVARARAADLHRQDPLDAARRGLCDRLRSAHRGRRLRTTCTLDVRLLPRRAAAGRRLYRVIDSEVDRRIILSDPGIDDFRNELLWSPERPTLLDAEITLTARRCGHRRGRARTRRCARSASRATASCSTAGRTCCGWCSIRATGPIRCWPRPSDEALRRDVELAKAMGFNGVRKHQKIEDPRYLYWADRLGLLVWEEMPSAYRFTRTRDQAHGARMDRSDRARLQPSVHHRVGAVQRIVGRARAADAQAAAPRGGGALPPDQDARRDAAGDRQRRLGKQRHRHHRHPRLRRRTRSTSHSATGAEIETGELFDRRRPGGRVLTLDGYPHRGQPIMLTEFGGIAFASARPVAGTTHEDLGLLHRRERRGVLRSATSDLMQTVVHTRAVQRLLLHAVRRHVPGDQRPAARRPHAEDSAASEIAQSNAAVAHLHPRVALGAFVARPMHRSQLTKPDGRQLTLYARAPIAPRPASAEPVRRRRSRASRTCAGIRCAASG